MEVPRAEVAAGAEGDALLLLAFPVKLPDEVFDLQAGGGDEGVFEFDGDDEDFFEFDGEEDGELVGDAGAEKCPV